MSKEFAQTIGGKRAWLLVMLLAAIAGLATLVSTWNSASAASTATWVTLPEEVAAQELPDSDAIADAIVLRHVGDDGDVLDPQDINNNVVGSRHTVCVFLDLGVLESDLEGFYEPINFGFLNVGDIIGVSEDHGASSFTNMDSFIGDESDFPRWDDGDGLPNADGASCFSWTSVGGGDQEIQVELSVNIGVVIFLTQIEDTDVSVSLELAQGFQIDYGTGNTNQSIIKEWNELTHSEIFIDGVSQGEEQDVTIPVGLLQLPNGEWILATEDNIVNIQDLFHGSHTMVTGQVYETHDNDTSLHGVIWEVTLSGCGQLEGDLEGQTYLEGVYDFATDTSDAIVTNYPDVDFDAGEGFDNCLPGDETVIEICGWEPSPQGSGTGTEVCQTITLVFSAPIEQKKVLLAWAGQRVVLEVDWRIPAGDENDGGDPEELGFCPFESFNGWIRYQAIAGDGGFVPGLGAQIDDEDLAFVELTGDDDQSGDAPTRPQDACISRVIYESEQQGQNDIEAFWEGENNNQTFNATKVGIVLYYMELESVTTSLVTSVEKPTHNGTNYDYAPGNPWDASDDVDTTEWNVSKDLLVRVRVEGWFTRNGTGTGREAKVLDNGLALPAGRFVMPTDWPLLAGGPNDNADLAGTGPAEDQPHYDILFDPNLTCWSLDEPLGGVKMPVAAVCTEVSSIDFAGPYSIIDLPAYNVSAALSDITTPIRDTIARDGDVSAWDAPMPPAEVEVSINGTGFLKQVYKWDVYYTGTPDDSTKQDYPNPYYYTHIPDSPYLPAVVFGGGTNWNTWGNDGPDGNGDGAYPFWAAVEVGGDSAELDYIREAYDDDSIGTSLVVYTDNHGEAMVTANGDYKTDLSGCETNSLGGGKRCLPGDVVGTGSIWARAFYPDFSGKNPPLDSNIAEVDWTWGGYKDISVHDDPAGNAQFKYLVFHAVDRDGFCAIPDGAVSLHPVLSGAPNDAWLTNPPETVDFLIDAGEGIIVDMALGGTLNDGRQFATGVKTFSILDEDAPLSFPRSEYAASADADECQAWVKVSNSLLGIVDFLVTAHDDEGDISFDRIIDLQDTASYTLVFRWSLITWAGADNIPVADALKGTGANEAGNDIYASVTAVFGWQGASQEWLAFFPAGVSIPGANDLIALDYGAAYWIAIVAPGPVTWTIATDVGAS